MPDVVTQRRHPQNAIPVVESIGIPEIWEEVSDLIRQIRGFGDYLKDATCEFHDTQRMLEPLVRSSRIEKISKCKLSDVPETLERPGVEHLLFIPV